MHVKRSGWQGLTQDGAKCRWWFIENNIKGEEERWTWTFTWNLINILRSDLRTALHSHNRCIAIKLEAPSYLTWIFTHLKLCLADASHNFKWVKISQMQQNKDIDLLEPLFSWTLLALSTIIFKPFYYQNKCESQHQQIEIVPSQIKQIWGVLTHLKLWVAVGQHSFKRVKIKIR